VPPRREQQLEKALAECLWLLADEYQFAGCIFRVQHPGITFAFGGWCLAVEWCVGGYAEALAEKP
jgi:hypothetical protein